MLFAALQRHLAQDAVNAWIFAPKIGTVVRKGLHGAWMNYPIFAHDIGALARELARGVLQRHAFLHQALEQLGAFGLRASERAHAG